MKQIYLSIILALFASPSLAQVAVAGSQSGAQAGSLAVSAGNSVPVTITGSQIPTHTTADVKTPVNLGGMGGWAYAAAAGPCLGPSETKQAGAQVGVMGWGAGGQYGYGQSNLDWGCVLARELVIASSMCQAKIQKACDDAAKLYELMPGVSAIRAGATPEYAKAQVVAPPAPAPRAAAPAAQPQRTAAIQQPVTCTSDAFISNRTGQPLCK